uniref:porin family protein n=1 Tax=Pedobacter schmidteae TaxID=2201271 RepID=UPI000EB09CCC|nr:porin family protein [Pedobacter schmidteae]
MKKLLLSLVILGAGLTASAQTNPVKFGVKAGVAFPSFSFSEEIGEGAKMTTHTSFYVGGTAEFSVSELFSVQPGLILSGKGAKAKSTEAGEIGEVKTSLMYIELPVNALVNFPVGDGKVFVGAGPYYSMAISGKNKASGTVEGETASVSVSDDVKFGKDGEYKRGDYGVNFLAGYQLSNGFNIHAGYGLGLGNIAQDSGDVTVKNKVLSVGVGFSF